MVRSSPCKEPWPLGIVPSIPRLLCGQQGEEALGIPSQPPASSTPPAQGRWSGSVVAQPSTGGAVGQSPLVAACAASGPAWDAPAVPS